MSDKPTDNNQDPEIQKATGKTDPVEVMAKLREMKNNFKWVSKEAKQSQPWGWVRWDNLGHLRTQSSEGRFCNAMISKLSTLNSRNPKSRSRKSSQ